MGERIEDQPLLLLASNASNPKVVFIESVFKGAVTFFCVSEPLPAPFLRRAFRLGQGVRMATEPTLSHGWRLRQHDDLFVLHRLEGKERHAGTFVLEVPGRSAPLKLDIHVAGRARDRDAAVDGHLGEQRERRFQPLRKGDKKKITSLCSPASDLQGQEDPSAPSSSSSSMPPPPAAFPSPATSSTATPSAPPAPWDPVHGPHLSLADLADARLPSDEDLGRASRHVPPERQEDLRRVAALLESLPSPPQHQQLERPLPDVPLHPAFFHGLLIGSLGFLVSVDEVFLVKRCEEAPRCAWYAHLPGDPSCPARLFCMW